MIGYLLLSSPVLLLTSLAVTNARLQGRVMHTYLAQYDVPCPAGHTHTDPRIFAQAERHRRLGWVLYAGLVSAYGGLVWLIMG